MKKINSPLHTQEPVDTALGTPLFGKRTSITSPYYLRLSFVALLLALLSFTAPSVVCAASPINVPLDPNDPVAFYGTYIVYHGQRIDLGPNALYVDGSLSTDTAANYAYVFNEVDDDKANVKALRPYINEAANKVTGTEATPIKVYFAPWVYWTDDPDDPTVSSSSGEKNRHGLNGVELDVTYIEFIGLTKNYVNVVICGNRGQSNGSDGNWNVLNLKANGFATSNITYGNYCTVDLVFPLKPAFNRQRRTNNGVQAQLFGFSSISGKVWADNCAFVSRLNLTPPAGSRTLYTNCHFESTDDSLVKGVYLNSNFDFYGSFPFGSISGSVLLNNIFRSHSTNEASAQYMTKSQTSGVMIDGAFTCFTDSGSLVNKPVEWTKVPPKYLRAYQANITLNGTPVDMSGDVPGLAVTITNKDALKAYKITTGGVTVYNTYNLLRGNDNWDPLGVKGSIEQAGADNIPTALTVSPSTRSIQTDTGSVSLTCTVAGSTTSSQANAGAIVWAIAPDYTKYAANITLTPSGDGKTCTVKGVNKTYAPFNVVITATSAIGLQGAALVTITPAQMSAPDFSGSPSILAPVNGKIGLDYKLNLPDSALTDQSLITWYRLDNNNWNTSAAVAVSRLNVPERSYTLQPGDSGKYIGVEIKPKHDVSSAGAATRLIYDTRIANGNITLPFKVHTDFRNFPLDYATSIKPGYWTVQNVSPTATQLTNWRKSGYNEGNEAFITPFAPSATESGWAFTDAGLDGAASTEEVYKYGLFFTRKGAELFYTPSEKSDYMQVKINLNPEKTAGQGFGSAGQYLDILIKYDLQLQRGYALRMMRISQGGKSVMFYLVEYKADGTVVPVCDPVWSSAMISDCLITLTADNSTGKLTAHVESTTPQASSAITEWAGHPSQEVVDMQANVTPNLYGGFGIFDIGSESSKNQHLFRSLDVVWTRESLLPVQTISFNAAPQNNGTVLLNWKVAAEHQNDYYLLERSNDGASFRSLGVVKAQSGGNSTQSLNYRFTDQTPVKGKNYYRLTQVDKDGKATQLGIQVVTLDSRSKGWAIYPNPVKADFTISLFETEKSNRKVLIADMSGKVIFSKIMQATDGKIEVRLGTAPPPGIYTIQVEGMGSKKLIF
ncbi:MAG: T9SS type A sorting domain-containing protein [Williamsia sp.]|nr:T9SS type A sorting domain-containing protein [Williamsia sp.]